MNPAPASVLTSVRPVARAVAAMIRSWAPRGRPVRRDVGEQRGVVHRDGGRVVRDRGDGEQIVEEGVLGGLPGGSVSKLDAGEVQHLGHRATVGPRRRHDHRHPSAAAGDDDGSPSSARSSTAEKRRAASEALISLMESECRSQIF
ncbi:MAG: hypothetical protein AB7G09_02840 [Pseudonocardia sp.]